MANSALWESFVRGGYPELAVGPRRDLALYHASHVQTYLERDVRTLRQVGDLVKLSSTPRPSMAASIRSFQGGFPDKAAAGHVAHPGGVRLPLGPGVKAIPFSGL